MGDGFSTMVLHRNAALVVVVAAACACSGSGGAQSAAFSPTWQNDRGRSIASVEERLRSVPRRPRTPAVVGVGGNRLVGATLPSGRVWRVNLASGSKPWIAGDRVVVRAGKEIVGIDVQNGRTLWRTDAHGLELGGADDDGRYTVLTLGGERNRLLALDRDGSKVLDLEAPVPLGRPAALGGVVFVPWDGQYVSAIDIASGETLARALLRDLVTHAIDYGTALYFGEKALVRFDEKIAFAWSNQANRFAFTPRELPGRPEWLGSGVRPSILDRSARAKIRIVARPADEDGNLGLASDSYAASYFRVVYGLAEGDGRLLWTDALRGDALGASAAASGFVFCDSTGQVRSFDANGGSGRALELGAPLIGCSVEASGLRVATASSRGSLPEQIERTLAELDQDMAAAENFLIRELGKLDEPVVTRALIGLSQNPRIPPAERTLARVLLAKRRNGVEYMLSALGRHYDFISGEQPPPVGPLADALAALGERRAAPLLAKQLNDPANALDDVAHAALALESLATSAEQDELETFFALYRATADEPLLVQAVLSIARALVRIGGPEGRAVVERAANDPLTQAPVRDGLVELLAPKPALQDEKSSRNGRAFRHLEADGRRFQAALESGRNDP